MKMFPWMNWKMKSVTVIALTVLIAGGLALLAVEKTAKVEKVEKAEKIEKGGRGFLGVMVENLSADEGGEPAGKNGVVVRSVQADGPAAKAGIQEKDLIQAVNGEKIGSAEELVEAVRELAPGTEVKIIIFREGKPLAVTAKLGEAKKQVHFSWKSSGSRMPFPPLPPFFQQGPYLGITLQELSADLASYFGVKAGEGVLVLDVEKESPAAKADLKAGDVIVEIGGQPAREPAAVSKLVRETKKGDKIALAVLRHGKKLTVTAEPGERQSHRRIKRVIRVGPGNGEQRMVVPEEDVENSGMDADFPEMDVDVEVPDMASVRECAKEAMEKAHADMEKTHVEMEKMRAEMEKNKEKFHRELRLIRKDRWI